MYARTSPILVGHRVMVIQQVREGVTLMLCNGDGADHIDAIGYSEAANLCTIGHAPH